MKVEESNPSASSTPPKWSFPIHFPLAKTGLRVGELVHLLVEDIDLDGGWLHVRNKVELGWRTETGQERVVPLLPEVVAVPRAVVGTRTGGLVFLRERPVTTGPMLAGDRKALEAALGERRARSESAPQVMAMLRNTVIHLLETVDATSKPAVRRRFAAHPNEAIDLISS